MGIVVKPEKAYTVCHGYKVSDDELILWSPGVIGALSDDEERKCRVIIIENASGGPQEFSSVEEALKVDTVNLPGDRMKQIIAIRQCAHILDRAEDVGLIQRREDTYALMDYCMDKFGFDGVQRYVPESIKRFVDKELKRIHPKTF